MKRDDLIRLMRRGDLVQVNAPWDALHGGLFLVDGITHHRPPFVVVVFRPRPNFRGGLFLPSELIKRARSYDRMHHARMQRKEAAMSPETNTTHIPDGMRLERRPTLSTRCDERALLRDRDGRVRAQVEVWVPEPTGWN